MMIHNDTTHELFIGQHKIPIQEAIIKKHDIGSATITLIPYQNGIASDHISVISRISYNDDGTMRKKLDFHADGSLKMKSFFLFENGLVSKTLITTDEGQWLKAYFYNKEGKLERYEFLDRFSDNPNPRVDTYKYDAKGNLESIKNYDVNGFMESESRLEYTSSFICRSIYKNFFDNTNGTPVQKFVKTFVTRYQTVKGNKKFNRKEIIGIDIPADNFLKLPQEKQDEILDASGTITKEIYASKDTEELFLISFAEYIPKNGFVANFQDNPTQSLVLNYTNSYTGKNKQVGLLHSTTFENILFGEPSFKYQYDYFKEGQGDTPLLVPFG